MRIPRIVVLLLFSWSNPLSGQSPEPVLPGTVYHDLNLNRLRDPGEPGLPGVRVSNGRDFATTDASGSYRLRTEPGDIVFVVKPRNWATPLTEHNLPSFYYIFKPEGSPALSYSGTRPTGPLPKSVDFALYPRVEPEAFDVLLFGDTQPRDETEIEYMAHDVIEELIGTDAAFGVTLGDVVYDDLSLFQKVNETVAQVGIPWYNAIGNHDLNFDASSDGDSDETFESVYGPRYYSFDYGPAHFLVLDTVYYEGAQVPGQRGDYRGGIDSRQLEFIEKDLKHVAADGLVVLLMHYPLVSSERELNIPERRQLLPLLEGRPSVSVSGHRHYMEHHLLGPDDGWTGPGTHLHLVNATVCGSWWRGELDELGIPHATMAGGSPNGYSILRVDGNQYSIAFKASRRPADYQMNIFAPEEIRADQAEQYEVLVNIFGGSEGSSVRMRLGPDGEWILMQKVLREDPFYLLLKQREQTEGFDARKRLPRPVVSEHLWRATFPESPRTGTSHIEVETRDIFGHVYRARRVVKVR